MQSRRVAVVVACLGASGVTHDLHGRPSTPAPSAIAGRAADVTVFENVAVIPLDTERVLTGQTVVIEHGVIAAMGPASQVHVPAGATKIDGTGQYLIPGLSDMHAHMLLGFTGAGTMAGPDEFEESDLRCDLAKWVANGATTLRLLDYGWPVLSRPELKLRDRQAAGELVAPHLYVSGPWGPMKNLGWPDSSPGPVRMDSIAAYVAAYKAAGYDFIKIHEEEGDVIDSVLAAAHHVHIPVLGHLGHGKFTIERAIKEGYRSIEHPLNEYASENIDWANPDTAKIRALALAMKRSDVWNTPTLAHYEGIGTEHNHGGSDVQARRRVVIKILQDAGVGLLVGTDNPAGEGLQLELRSLVRAGLTPYQALVAGSRNVAVYFGISDKSGTIAVGKRADLVLLKANPLDDINNAANIAGVMIGGHWVPATDPNDRLPGC